MGFDKDQYQPNPGLNMDFEQDNAGLDQIHRQQRGASAVLWVVVVVLLAAGGWYWQSTRPDPLDEKMRIQAAQLEKAVMRYHADEADYPARLEEASQYFPVAGQWPVEPYTGRTIADTGTDEFEPENSVGMVHYVRIETDGETGYRLTVFGRDGILQTRWGGYVTGN